MKNGLLAVELSQDQVDEIFELVGGNPGLRAEVDLERQEVVVLSDPPRTFSFSIESGAREQLLKGLDDIDQTLLYEAEITHFEKEYDLFAL